MGDGSSLLVYGGGASGRAMALCLNGPGLNPSAPPQMLSTYSPWASSTFLSVQWEKQDDFQLIPYFLYQTLCAINCEKIVTQKMSIWSSPLCCTSLRSRTSCRRPSSWPRGASCSSPPISCSQTFGARGRNRTKKFRRCLNIGNWNWRKLSWSMESVTLSWDMRLFHLTLIYISKCVVSLLSLWHMAKMQISR